MRELSKNCYLKMAMRKRKHLTGIVNWRKFALVALLGVAPVSNGFLLSPTKGAPRSASSRLWMGRSPFGAPPPGQGGDGPPPLPPGFSMDDLPGGDDWNDDAPDPFAPGPDGRDPGQVPNRMQAMMAQAQQKQEMQQAKEEWEPRSGLAEEQRKEAQKRDAAARATAREEGYDPDDEESMKKWRRAQADKARLRMAANAAAGAASTSA